MNRKGRRKGFWQGIVGFCPVCKTEGPIDIHDSTLLCNVCRGPLQPTPTWPAKVQKKDSTSSFPYPERDYSEVEVVCYLLNTLKNDLNWHVRGEVSSKEIKGRCEIVIYNKDREAVRIIEVKGKTPIANSEVTKTDDEFVCWHYKSRAEKQLNRYRMAGIPVDYVIGMERAKEYVEWAKERGGTPERKDSHG